MKVTALRIKDFRGLRDVALENLDPKINALVGINGSGKSSLLDCIAILLSRLFGRIRSDRSPGRLFLDSDISNSAPSTTASISVRYGQETVTWSVTKTRAGRKKQTISNLEDVKELAARLQNDADDPSKNLPLAVYYPVNRAVLDVPLRIRKRHPFDPIAAFEQALAGGRNDFRLFFEWFREREDIENEQRVRSSKAYAGDHQLNAVRHGITSFLPELKQLRIQRSPLRMVAEKGNETISVNQFSDGEKCLLAMVGDLARRLSIANPGLKSACEGHAVVLIDELELHLHPRWQRLAVPQLLKTFPNCQFFVSTHSPQIVSHLQAHQVLALEAHEGVAVHRVEQSYGLTSNRILEDIFDVEERPAEIKAKVEKLYQLIDRAELESAQKSLRDIEGRIGTDLDLVKAGVLIRKKQLLAQ